MPDTDADRRYNTLFKSIKGLVDADTWSELDSVVGERLAEAEKGMAGFNASERAIVYDTLSDMASMLRFKADLVDRLAEVFNAR